ncbi:MAG: mechanosensitive ion channel [Cyclobacteriaceae bacterium]|nr:mechanosensitive ion channel [Cyclobacteriaceae bacterium]
MDNVQAYIDTAIEYAMLYLPKLFLALIFLVIGAFLIRKVNRGVKNLFLRREMDPSLIPFLSGFLNALLWVLLIISVASMIGIATTSFIAVLGAAGLAIGLALQGSLGNFAGGILILILRPYKVGDVIEAQGVIALVTEIQIFHTILKSYDNKVIIIPNGPLGNSTIINYSTMETRLVEWVFGISYDDDIDKAKTIIKKIVFTDSRVLNQESPFINLAELGDSSVNFKVRAEVAQADYWSVFFEMTENVKKAFDKEGITIPYPQRDVHLFSENKNS